MMSDERLTADEWETSVEFAELVTYLTQTDWVGLHAHAHMNGKGSYSVARWNPIHVVTADSLWAEFRTHMKGRIPT
jgi:hypothetical protein